MIQQTTHMPADAIAYRLEIEAQLGGRDQALEVFRAALRDDPEASTAWWTVVRAAERAAALAGRYPGLH